MNEPQNDPAKANSVWARLPKPAPEWGMVLVHPETVTTWVRMRAWAKIGEYAGLVHGRFGDSVPVVGTPGLLRPTAIFRGLKRPLFNGHQHCDKNMLIYVTNPGRSYEFGPAQRRGGFPAVTEAPVDAVFTTFVSVDPGHVDEVVQAVQGPAPNSILGVVTQWEWTEASQKHPSLPFDYENRYEEQVL